MSALSREEAVTDPYLVSLAGLAGPLTALTPPTALAYQDVHQGL